MDVKNNNIYNENSQELYTKFNSSSNGLNDEFVKTNAQKYGINQLVVNKRKPWWRIFLDQLKDTLMIILIICSVISLIVSIFPTDGESWGKELTKIEGWENFILIIGVLIINGTLGTIQTIKSQKSLDSLRKLSSPKTKIKRNGIPSMIDTNEVVVGDIVILEAGDLVPADGRVISSSNLRVNESSLTGESEPVVKNNLLINKNDVILAERFNMVFSGCLVTYGHGEVLITAVGEHTELGKINRLLNSTKDIKTPLQVNMDKLSKTLMWIVLAICLVLFVFNISKIAFIDQTLTNVMAAIGTTLNFSVALAVAAVPESLSSIVTIVLAISTKRMAKKNAIVKDLKSVEGLGSVSVICSDKTGTITQNKMTVKGFYVDGKIYNENEINTSNIDQLNLIKYSVLSSDAKVNNDQIIGDPTEVCLIEYYQKQNLDSNKLDKECPRICDLSFDSERMMMSTLVKIDNKNLMLTKGAFDVLLPKCTKILDNNKIRPITKKDLLSIKLANDKFANEGKRVLCFVLRNDINKNKISFDDENDFTFVGLISMIDPPREEVINAIKECHTAGIKVVMITGDHQTTAVAIAKEIGIFGEDDLAMSGNELSKIDQDELAKIVKKYAVYARVSPEDKIKIVKAWQSHNKIVSMTGDGVNDAPALKQANVGVAMGITGTEVSKDAASIVLTDDNFATIFSAIKFGRSVYNNIKSATKFLLTGNFAAVLVAIVITIFSLIMKITISPFSAIQLLFLNILCDTWPAISLGLEKYRNDVIYEKPRLANEYFINKKFLLNLLWEALVISLSSLFMFFIVYFNVHNVQDINLQFQVSSIAAFLTLGFSRTLYSFNCKSEKPILFSKQLFDNPFLIGSLFLNVGLILLIYFTPGVNQVFLTLDTHMKLELYNFKNNLVWISLLSGVNVLFIVQTIRYIKFFCIILKKQKNYNHNLCQGIQK